jgi:hypothetical protein
MNELRDLVKTKEKEAVEVRKKSGQ